MRSNFLHRTILKVFVRKLAFVKIFVFSLLRAPGVYLRAVGSFIGTPVVTMVDGLPPELSIHGLASRKKKTKAIFERKMTHFEKEN